MKIPCYIEHYSTEDGLPQHTVMDMVQDKKGLMWFVTWDGFCKFDGYDFTSYKIQPENTYYMRNNRIDYIYEDKYGFLWLQSYDGEPHRFDPRTETFKGLQQVKEYENFSFISSKIVLTPSGKTWLLSKETGCICVLDPDFNTEVYNNENGRLKGKTVFAVFEDKSLNSWLLTDNGLVMIAENTTDPVSFFTENDNTLSHKQSFHSAIEFDSEIWFGSNEGRVWKYNKQSGEFKLFETHVASDIIKVEKISERQSVIITSGNGFFITDIDSGELYHYNKSNSPLMKSDVINSSYIDKNRNFWLETDQLGIIKFNLDTRTFKYFKMDVEEVNQTVPPSNFFIIEDINGRIWAHLRGGGFAIYNKENDTLEQLYDPDLTDWRFSNMFHSAYSDRQGNLWLCSRSHGLEKVVFDKNEFHTRQLDSNVYSAVANDVRAVFEDNDENKWIATKEGKIRIYDKDYNFLGYLCRNGMVGIGPVLQGAAYCITQDSSGKIWIGTKGNGIFVAQKKKSNKLDFSIENYRKIPEDIYSLNENSVYSIYEDSKGHIWVGTYGGGLNLISPQADGTIKFINQRNNLKNYPAETGNRVRFVTEDNYKNICIGTTGGLILFKSDFSSPENISYKRFEKIPGQEESLSNNDVHGIKVTRSGDTYIATFGGGINQVVERDSDGFPLKFKTYGKQHGLPSDVTLSIEEDESGKLWISSENNLTKFDPLTGIFETFGEIKRLMQTNSFSEASTFRCRSNEIIFGYSNGILSFFPEQITNNTFKPYICFEFFELFNKLVDIGENSPLKVNIDDTAELVLTHKQNFFTIGYAALDYTNPNNIQYAYKLDGMDDDWQYVQKQRIANYTNLPKGKYVFRVKSTNGDGIWIDNERSLSIEILPSFWETYWAYLIYFLLFILLVFICVRILFVIYRLKDKVEMEHELSEMKLRFFTDVSHEIRTPLTMITAPLDHLLQNNQTPEFVKSQLRLMETNTNRMLRLVNQILDFRKMQQKQLKIEFIELAPYFQEIFDNFLKIATDHHISYQFINRIDREKVWIDRDCVEKIAFNLLSNAFKYTPPGKAIIVTLYNSPKGVCFEVQDEGKGIVKEKQKSLFTRFASFNDDKSKPSTGIGLSMVKDLTDKLGATVSFESEEGKGSRFTVCFQSGLSHFGKNVDIVIPEEKEALTEIVTNPSRDIPEEEKEVEKQTQLSSILVVEDDDDLRKFLVTILNPDYIVYEAVDGAEGLEVAAKVIPDFIVSDIMMPRIDGVELLRQLKSNLNTSHIPVVLLTAKTTIESKLEGLGYGADDYITKPFSVPYFRARIQNLLKQRKHLQELYMSNLRIPSLNLEPTEPTVVSQDDKLMEKVIQEIEKNMENNDFSIEDLRSSVGLSRTVFFKKIKSLTGLAPVEFIRDIKIKRAAQLLSTGQLSVKEVSFMVGISDPAYFRKCFKAKYDLTPAEYKEKHMK